VRIRHVLLIVAVVVTAATAAGAGILGTSRLEPPIGVATGAIPVAHTPPVPADTIPSSTVAPQPFTAPSEATGAPLPGPASTAVPIAPPPKSAAPLPTPPSGPLAAVGAPPEMVARVVPPQVAVWTQPTDEHAAFALLRETEWGNQRILLVSELRDDWVRVVLPLRPNGSEGWVRIDDVELSEVADRIDVSLANRTLRWSRAGQVLLDATVGIGAVGSETPPGDFYVTDVLAADPADGRGAWILALNGYSEALDTYQGGLPRLAIHGTSSPGSIGRAASAGCVRVSAEVLVRLAAGVPVGTPVIIG
jgi:lipoprotein-anchoring transpeptidase ErfK/SrfK